MTNYTIPTTCLSDDLAANLAHFLVANGKGICGAWKGHMRAADQRRLFGRFLGKGTLIIDGNAETLKMFVSVCFGTDFDLRACIFWREL